MTTPKEKKEGGARRLKIAVSGVRGVVGETFSPMLASDFASAFGEFAGRGAVLLGRDTRRSGALFEHAVIAGLTSVGVQVLRAGIVPTPSLQMAVRDSGAAGGIMITASHNPVEWNALKFIGPDGFFLDERDLEALLDIYNQPDLNYVTEQDFRPVRRAEEVFRRHQERIFAAIDVEAVRSAHFKVAVDCCNGVGALYSRPFLEAMGVEVIPLFDSPDEPFGRPPEPLARNLGALSDTVRREHCDVGFAQDPDGDRIALITETGRPAGVQYSLLPMVEHLLSRPVRSGRAVAVANVQTTRAFDLIAEKHGYRVIRTPVGEVNVTAALRAHDAVIGIEGSSGGLIVPSILPCRDSFSAMALMLEMMALRRLSPEQIFDSLPRLFSAETKVECPSAQATVDRLRKLAADYAPQHPDLTDGVRINFGDSWVLARLSNTEPILRILAEAESMQKAESLAGLFAEKLRDASRKGGKKRP